MPSPVGISAGKPTAKTFKLGAALEIIPRDELIKRSPNRIGNAIETAPRNICELQMTKLWIIKYPKIPEAIGTS